MPRLVLRVGDCGDNRYDRLVGRPRATLVGLQDGLALGRQTADVTADELFQLTLAREEKGAANAREFVGHGNEVQQLANARRTQDLSITRAKAFSSPWGERIKVRASQKTTQSFPPSQKPI
jgi:hypothetical protein